MLQLGQSLGKEAIATSTAKFPPIPARRASAAELTCVHRRDFRWQVAACAIQKLSTTPLRRTPCNRFGFTAIVVPLLALVMKEIGTLQSRQIPWLGSVLAMWAEYS